MGRGGPVDPPARVLPRAEDEADGVIGSGEHFADVHALADPRRTILQRHRTAVPQERGRARRHRVPTGLFAAVAAPNPIGKTVRVGPERFTIVGVFDKTPSAGGFNLGADRLRGDSYTVYQRVFGLRAFRVMRTGTMTAFMISVIPRDGVSQADALVDVQRVMRSRHGLKLDQPDDFDLVTQDAFLKLWGPDQPGHVLRAGGDLVHRADRSAASGVMAIMSISVTERTREIGVRKALGARRGEILFQFLVEAAALTSAGGLIGSRAGRFESAGPFT